MDQVKNQIKKSIPVAKFHFKIDARGKSSGIHIKYRFLVNIQVLVYQVILNRCFFIDVIHLECI